MTLAAEQVLPLPADLPYQEVRHGFEVANNRLLIPQGLYSEIVSRPRICRIPTTPNWFCGFINHRGETVPVFDLTGYLGLRTGSTEKRWVLLLDEQPHMVGILLDAPPQGITAPQPGAAADPSISPALAEYCGAPMSCTSGLWTEFEHRRLFAALKNQF